MRHLGPPDRGRDRGGSPPPEILYEDNALVAINKPSGWTTQGAMEGDPSSAVDWVKSYLRVKYAKPGKVFLGVVHRLDRPVSGVLVFARNSKAAARLSEQFRLRSVRKVYRAIVERAPTPPQGRLAGWILKREEETRAWIAPGGTPGALDCALTYRTLAEGTSREPALVEIELETGRRHQIRAQFADRGCPVVGDRLYGAKTLLQARPTAGGASEIALHAHSLTIAHPIRRDGLTITAPAPDSWSALLRRIEGSTQPRR